MNIFDNMKSPADAFSDPFSQFKIPSPSTAISAQPNNQQIQAPAPNPGTTQGIGSNIYNAMDFWSNIYNATHPNQDPNTDILQKFLDDNSIDPSKKRAALSAMNDNPQDEQKIRDHIQQNYYSDNNFQLPTSQGFQMHETIPGSQTLESMKFKDITEHPENYWTNIAKMWWNAILNAGQLAIWWANLASTYGQELAKWIPEWKFNPLWTAYDTLAWGIINPALAGVQNEATKLSKTYNQSGALATAGQWLQDIWKFASENPVTAATIFDPLLARDVVAKTWEVASNIPWNIKSWIGNIPEVAKNVWNTMSETLLSSFQKFDKATKRWVNNAVGMTPEKFALENDLVWQSVWDTADKAGQFKFDLMQQKIDAVKNFWDTITAPVDKRLATSVKTELETALSKWVWAKNFDKLTPDQLDILQNAHPEQMKVIDAMNTIIKWNKVSYASLEALKNLYDHYNPDSIKWWLDGKPENTAMSEVSASQRGTLQKKIEDAGIKNWIDIKWINSKIQAAHSLESGALASERRIANHNLIWLWDTQIAALAGIITGWPWALASLLVKKWLFDNQWVRSAVARKLYTKDVKNTNGNIVTNNAPVSRVGRIINNMTPTADTIVKKDLIQPNKLSNESKVIKPTTGDTIPEGYTKNAFWEIIKKPGYKKGGFIRIGSEPKKISNIPKELQWLAEEAKKYNSAKDFYDAHISKDLMDLSDPAKQRFGRLLEDGIDEDTGMYMNAKYTADKYGIRWNNEYKYQKSANVPDVKSENDMVTIYRSTSKEQKEMLPWDFVSFSKDYAEMHNTEWHTLTMRVPAKDVVFQWNDLHEWIFSPENLRWKKYDGWLEWFFKKHSPKKLTK